MDHSMLTRRALLTGAAHGVGVAALAHLHPAHAAVMPRAKRVISLFQFGGPSQHELFDEKPQLKIRHGQELPPSVRGNGPISGLSRGQAGLPVVGSPFSFQRESRTGLAFSELLPHTAKMAPHLCMIRSVTTDAVAHDPALTLMQSGAQLPGKASIGSWVSYGLGSGNRDLPSYVVLTSKGSGDKDTQPLGPRLWSSGYLPSSHQGVAFRASGDPVLYLGDPPGISRQQRRNMLDAVTRLDARLARTVHDPEITTRIAQYELAFRMQSSVPDLLDFGGERQDVFDLYGADTRRPGSYAANCLLARRLVERGVRFVQLFHRGWDQHRALPEHIRLQCGDTDQPTAALLMDLERRGLLEDTLVIWGGEFGRTAYCQGKLSQDDFGRDHHGRSFTMWLAGGGIKGGVSYGETDDFGYNVTRDPVPLRDLHATVLHCAGLDPSRLSFRFQGLDQRLTGVGEPAKILTRLLV